MARQRVKAGYRVRAQAYHLVLHRQTLAWAMRESVQAIPAGNNHMRAWLVRVGRATER